MNSKSGMANTDIDYLFCGDLLGQLIATSFGAVDFNIPLFGLYGACSTFGEALSLGSILIDSGNASFVPMLYPIYFGYRIAINQWHNNSYFS